ncbi:eCIS core domain-containing protein [Sneathiella glossodoripedis]|uniref:eCIS core domain-containing protein n=1 Tax=Sneathiella glossodoripedis TaxID=418853 RepID=UPI0004720388|nr:DUF4157 domain-containing protein [Sneathiella glossodoripedis]
MSNTIVFNKLCLFIVLGLFVVTTLESAGAAKKLSGSRCEAASECSSGYCYPYPNSLKYCLDRDLNCAAPNSNGLTFGSVREIGGVRYQCKSGSGWVLLGNKNGSLCQNGTQCESGYCYDYVDGNRYCLRADLNCALPNADGVSFTTRIMHNNQRFECKSGKGWVQLAKADGLSCVKGTDCASGYCYPYLDGNRYCLKADLNCAFPQSTGVKFGYKMLFGNKHYICKAAKGWAENIAYLAKDFTRWDVKIGKFRDCSGLSWYKKADCERLRETQKLTAEPYEAAIHRANRSSRSGGVRPIPEHIREKLKRFFEPELLNLVRFRVGFVPLSLIGSWQLFSEQASAMTFGNVIVFKDSTVERDVCLWAHEIEHVKQYNKLGIDGFAQRYLYEAGTLERPGEAQARYVCSFH